MFAMILRNHFQYPRCEIQAAKYLIYFNKKWIFSSNVIWISQSNPSRVKWTLRNHNQTVAINALLTNIHGAESSTDSWTLNPNTPKHKTIFDLKEFFHKKLKFFLLNKPSLDTE